MIVLTVNSGSTSVKLAAFELEPHRALKPLANAKFTGNALDPVKTLETFRGQFPQRVDAVAHRVVHGGTRFTGPAVMDDDAVAAIESLNELAPLHNPMALRWIAAARSIFRPPILHVAAFDTSFFSSMPRVATEYAVPPASGTELDVRRFGFHGLAHEAMWRRWCELRPELPEGGRLITFQLGGGCSVAAIKNGRPLDTSMGFSPLEGLVMATRSGDIDAAAIPYLANKLRCTPERIVERLNRESGLAGLSGVSGNMDEVLANDSPSARFAFELYCYRARKYLGAYLTVLGGCDGVIFGGGVGEHSPEVRATILRELEWAGIVLAAEANRAAIGTEARISPDPGKVVLYAMPVDEAQTLARAACDLSESSG